MCAAAMQVICDMAATYFLYPIPLFMPSHWGPLNEELMNVQMYQFSANYDTIPQLDQISDEDNRDSDELEARVSWFQGTMALSELEKVLS